MAMLLIRHPPTYGPERKYIYDVMFCEFLGIGYRARIGDYPDMTEISVLGDSSGRRLTVHEALFTTASDKWLTEESLPPQPLEKWMLPDVVFDDTPKVSSEIPVIYGQAVTKDSYYAEHDHEISLGLDVFGSAFFMLTRYEEVVKDDRDKHDRFPAKASLAYQEEFLERPIVNEYLEILWTCMKRLWPGLYRKRRFYEVFLSHDVDRPLAVAGKPWPSVVLSCGADILRRRDLDLASRRFYARCYEGRGDFDVDPFNTFDFIMGVSEQYGLRSAFYFMANEKESATRFDGLYSIEHPWIRKLMQRILQRGHEIGFHGSYNACTDAIRTKCEVEALRLAMQTEEIDKLSIGGRMHYLRWIAPYTWESWEYAGLDYDSSLIFAEHVGFRSGTCYDYSVFNVLTRRQLQLVERPLMIMETSMISPLYMNLSTEEEIYDTVACLRKNIRIFNGQFALLWHNSNLASKRDKNVFAAVVEIMKA